MAGNQGEKSNNIGDNNRSPPTRPIPRRGPVDPVPAGGNNSGSSSPLPLDMGVPGVSAFTPYDGNRALLMSPPPISRPTPRRGAVDPVPAGANSVSPSPRPQMGVPGVSVFTPFVRKTTLDEGSSTSAVAGGGGMDVAVVAGDGPRGDGNGDRNLRCSICDKVFPSGKALFGHMRSHPGRGWKGARPPPAFNASEEFADLVPLLHPPPPVPRQLEAPTPADASGDRVDDVEGEADSIPK